MRMCTKNIRSSLNTTIIRPNIDQRLSFALLVGCKHITLKGIIRYLFIFCSF